MMTPTTNARIAASILGDMTTVRIGYMSKADWDRNYDDAVERGVVFPETFRASVEAFRTTAWTGVWS